MAMKTGDKISAIAKELIDNEIQQLFLYAWQKTKLDVKDSYYKRGYVYNEFWNKYICSEIKYLKYSTPNR